MKSRSPFDNYFLRDRETNRTKISNLNTRDTIFVFCNRFIETTTTSNKPYIRALVSSKFVRGVCANLMTIKLDFHTNDGVSAYTYILVISLACSIFRDMILVIKYWSIRYRFLLLFIWISYILSSLLSM